MVVLSYCVTVSVMVCDSVTPVFWPTAVTWNLYVPAGVPLIVIPPQPVSDAALLTPARSSARVISLERLRAFQRPRPAKAKPGRKQSRTLDDLLSLLATP